MFSCRSCCNSVAVDVEWSVVVIVSEVQAVVVYQVSASWCSGWIHPNQSGQPKADKDHDLLQLHLVLHSSVGQATNDLQLLLVVGCWQHLSMIASLPCRAPTAQNRVPVEVDEVQP